MTKSCAHHYKIESPNGPTIQGICGCSCAPESPCSARQRRNSTKRGCGAVRRWATTDEHAIWNEGVRSNNNDIYNSRPRTYQVMD